MNNNQMSVLVGLLNLPREEALEVTREYERIQRLPFDDSLKEKKAARDIVRMITGPSSSNVCTCCGR